MAGARGRADGRNGDRRRRLHQPFDPHRLPAFGHLPRAGGFRNEREHSRPGNVLVPAAAACERSGCGNDHRLSDGGVCVSNRPRRSGLAGHADAHSLSWGAVALSRKVDAQCHRRRRSWTTDRQSARPFRGQLPTDLPVRLAGRGGGNPHAGPHDPTLCPWLAAHGFNIL